MTARSPSTSPLLPVAALLGSILSVTIGTSFAKHLFPLIGAQGTTAFRVTFSALVLLALWRPWRLPLTWPTARAIAVYGAALGLMNLGFYMALRTIPLAVAVAILFLGPLSVAMAASRRLKDFVWIGFVVLGLGLLLWPRSQAAPSLDPTGVAFALCASVCWALYIIFGQKAGKTHGGQATSLGLTVAALIVLPIGLAHAGRALFNPSLLLAGLGVGILSSALPFSLEMYALKRLPKQTFGVLLSLEPAVGALTAFLVLGERLTPTQWLAIGCIIVASAGSALNAPAPADTAESLT
ncbi:DMT family transporter [bacterium]|nr:DMT family transporter [bacterium]